MAVLGCVGTYLAVPQVQDYLNNLSNPNPTNIPTIAPDLLITSTENSIIPSATAEATVGITSSSPQGTVTSSVEAQATTTLVPTDTLSSATNTPEPTRGIGEPISMSFLDQSDPNYLSTIFGSQPGSSPSSSISVDKKSGALIIVAGPNTDHYEKTETGPLVTYPYSGDFDVQVKLQADPQILFQNAGLGICSASTHYTWIRFGKYVGYKSKVQLAIFSVNQGVGVYESQENWPYYSQEDVYIKIERRGPLFTFLYSTNGKNWNAVIQELPLGMPDDVEIFLDVNAHVNESLVTKFSDLTITNR